MINRRTLPPARVVSSAFSRTELFIVIIFLGVFAALFSRVRLRTQEAERTAQCLNNHRRLVQGWTLYAQANGGTLPWTLDDGDNVRHSTNWVSGNLRNEEEATNSALLVNPHCSQLAPFVTEARVYKCPSDPSEFVRSVSMNNRLNPVRFARPPLVLGGYGTNWIVYRRRSDIQHPSEIFVTLDERYDSINEGNFAVDLSNTGTLTGEGIRNPYWWLDTPASYHNRAVMFSFADGHAERHEWLEGSTLGPIGLTGFRHTSARDQDISWLQQHTAERVNAK